MLPHEDRGLMQKLIEQYLSFWHDAMLHFMFQVDS